MPSMRHNALATMLLLSTLMAHTISAAPTAEETHPDANAAPTAPYLLAGAPTFELTVIKFREKYNAENPTLPIGEFRAIEGKQDAIPLTRAASKIDQTLYASTALEKGSGKIKTLQLTYLPQQGPEDKAARSKAVDYMAALMRTFEPALTPEQSVARMAALLEKGKGSHFYQEQVGAIRYVIADNGEKGITFAVEPIKLVLSEP